jgi:hypothetical protein
MHFLRLCQPIWVCNALRDVNVREQSASLHHECVVGQPSGCARTGCQKYNQQTGDSGWDLRAFEMLRLLVFVANYVFARAAAFVAPPPYGLGGCRGLIKTAAIAAGRGGESGGGLCTVARGQLRAAASVASGRSVLNLDIRIPT